MSGETPDQDESKRDRQMIELLNELRVAMPGVQILFGFLLTVPFAQGFTKVTNFQRDVYFAREWLVEHANRMLIVGLVFLGLALLGAVLMVTDFIFDGAIVVITPVALAAIIVGLWFVRPLARR